jgi:hypothetical protein
MGGWWPVGRPGRWWRMVSELFPALEPSLPAWKGWKGPADPGNPGNPSSHSARSLSIRDPNGTSTKPIGYF